MSPAFNDLVFCDSVRHHLTILCYNATYLLDAICVQGLWVDEVVHNLLFIPGNSNGTDECLTRIMSRSWSSHKRGRCQTRSGNDLLIVMRNRGRIGGTQWCCCRRHGWGMHWIVWIRQVDPWCQLRSTVWTLDKVKSSTRIETHVGKGTSHLVGAAMCLSSLRR